MGLNQYALILYEKALQPGSWEQMFSDTAELGFDGFELSIDESDERLERLNWSDRECLQLIRTAKEKGIRLQSLCFSGQRRFPMGSANPCVVRHSMELMKKCIHLCANLGIRVLQVAGYDVFYEAASPDTYQRYVYNLKKAVQIAERYGVMLAIEPVEMGITSVSMALKIIREIGSPFLQVYPDIANMASLGIDYYSEIEKGMGHIVQLHVRDALPDYFYGVDIGTGIIDFVKTFQLFGQLGISCPITLEMWNMDNPHYFKTVAHAREFLLNSLNKADKKQKG